MSNQILIARPNAFIVKNMKSILDDCGKSPVLLNSISEIEKFKSVNLSGVVISTAVSSTIDGSFEEVLRNVIERFQQIPILLPTMLNIDKAKNSINTTLSNIGISYDLISIEEASKRTVNSNMNTMMILRREDIAESVNYARSVSTIKKFLK